MTETAVETPSTVPIIQIKLAKKYYFQGDQVSGEVLLEVPAPLSGLSKLELKTWSTELGSWTAINKGKETTFHGGKPVYSTTTALKEMEDGNLHQGTYLIPFTYYMPYKIAASTTFKGRQFDCSVQHFIQVRLIPQVGKVMEQLGNELPCITQATHELILLERPGYQSSLKPYAWQCTYSIPHLLLGSGDLIVTIRKGIDPCIPGDEVPLWVEFQNRSQTTVTGVRVTLCHTIATVSHGGTYKEVVYHHTQWIKPVLVQGGKKHMMPTPLSVPLRLPKGLSSTAHGSSVTSEYELRLSCRYKGRLTVTSHTTGADLIFPLTVWNPDPVYRNGDDLKHILSLIGETTQEPSQTTAEKKSDDALIQTTLVPLDTQATEWPPVSFLVASDGGKPAATSIVRLCKGPGPSILPQSPPEALAAEVFYKTSDIQCRLDLGLTMSPALAKRLQPMDGAKTKKERSKQRATSGPVRKKVAPLQK